MKIGFTGTQVGMSFNQRNQLEAWIRRYQLEWTEFHHGDCIGADEQSHILALTRVQIVIHPPTDSKKRAFCFRKTKYPECLLVTELEPFPYLERNHHIVDQTDTLIAAPRTMEEELRSGTWATIRYAKKLGRPVWILPR